jgi:hypothetical protein
LRKIPVNDFDVAEFELLGSGGLKSRMVKADIIFMFFKLCLRVVTFRIPRNRFLGDEPR